MKVEVQIAPNSLSRATEFLPSQEDFQRWADAVGDSDAEVCVRIVDNDEAAELNSRYRNTSGVANVLAFPFDSLVATDTVHLGDVVIAAPLVASEAREQGKNPDSHWAHLFVHGLLHLQGFDHRHEESAWRMESHEKEILNKLGFPDPY